MGLGHSPSIIPDGLVFYFDPINTRSYAGTGLTGYNLINTAASGALVGGALYDIANKGSIYLDGVNDYINFTTQPISDNNSLSINCWVKFTTIPSTFTPIIDAGNVGGGTSGYCISFDNARKIYMAINSGFVNINYTFSTNTWYNITGSAQQGSPYSIKVYVNGVEAAIGSSGASNSLTGINSNIRIGSNFVGTITYLNSNIASLSIYNRALSASEILQNYNVTKKRFSPEENIVRDNLILNLDAGNSSSYAGTGTSWYDTSGNNYSGTITNGPAFSGQNGGMITFDGTNDHIVIPGFSITGSFTIEVWCFTTSLSGVIVVGKYGGGSYDFWVGVFSSRFYFSISISGSKAEPYTATISANTWYHVTAVYNASALTASIYLNGTLSQTVSGTFLFQNPPGNYAIGAFGENGSYYWPGNIPIHRYYNRVLTSAEILQNYNATKGRYGLS